MKVSISDAKAQLAELVRVAESGDEVVLTRHGKDAARIVPVKRILTYEEKMAVIDEIRASAHKALPGACAARSQDFLYDDDGLPG